MNPAQERLLDLLLGWSGVHHHNKDHTLHKESVAIYKAYLHCQKQILRNDQEIKSFLIEEIYPLLLEGE